MRRLYLIDIDINSSKNQNVKIIDWLSNLSFQQGQAHAFGIHGEGTGEWFLNDPVFKSWLNGKMDLLWCPSDGKIELLDLILIFPSWIREDDSRVCHH